MKYNSLSTPDMIHSKEDLFMLQGFFIFGSLIYLYFIYLYIYIYISMWVLIYLFCFWAAYLQIHMYPQWGFLRFFFFHTHQQQQPTICNMASRFYKQIAPQGGDTTKTPPCPLARATANTEAGGSRRNGKVDAIFFLLIQ